MAAMALAMLVKDHDQCDKITQVLTQLPPKISVVLAAAMPGVELEQVFGMMAQPCEARILTSVPPVRYPYALSLCVLMRTVVAWATPQPYVSQKS